MDMILNVRDEFLLGTHGALFLREKIKTLTEMQKARDSGNVPLMRETVEMAKKPWDDRGKAPWGDGDPDGTDNGAYEMPPGETSNRKPSGDDNDGDEIRFRDLCNKAVMAGGIAPETSMSLIAIEARLGEISLYLPQAINGTNGKIQSSLTRFRAAL